MLKQFNFKYGTLKSAASTNSKSDNGKLIQCNVNSTLLE